jgi:hypothetical protein
MTTANTKKILGPRTPEEREALKQATIARIAALTPEQKQEYLGRRKAALQRAAKSDEPDPA